RGAHGSEGRQGRDGRLALRRRQGLPAGRRRSEEAQVRRIADCRPAAPARSGVVGRIAGKRTRLPACVSLASLFAQLLNGLAGASSLFLVAAGLTLIFGVTRVVNFAHGSLYMLGAYLAWTLARAPGLLGFWGAVPLAALAVAAIGAAIERLLLR